MHGHSFGGVGGSVSGAHFNPAVTLGIYLRGKIPIVDGLLYIAAQLAGAFIGAWFSNDDLDYPCVANSSRTNKCGAGFPNISPEYDAHLAAPFFMEAIWTFFLVSVVLNSATTKAQEGNSFFGFAIGSVVLSGAVSMGPISGGAFNPAVGTALPVIAGTTQYIWLYWLAPMLGGASSSSSPPSLQVLRLRGTR
jgi:aquaporin Z